MSFWDSPISLADFAAPVAVLLLSGFFVLWLVLFGWSLARAFDREGWFFDKMRRIVGCVFHLNKDRP